jgi:flagellar assembly protein FliH
MTQDTLPPRNLKKFLFDNNNFDTPDPDFVAPPVYSQEELSHNKQSSYDQGKADGYAEAQASFEKQTTDLLMAIRDHFSILFDEEDRRARMFEKESAQLAYTIFARAFPALNEKLGLQEVKTAIQHVLETVREQPEIIVEVPQAYVGVIQGHIDHLLRRDGGPRCIVRASDHLGAGQARMMWTNGHAMRDGPQLAERIRLQIEQMLADQAILADNSEEITAAPPPGEV